ncbi:MAG: hypothetical protein H6742_20255 [Alphaproteobacteria bacterium]|nr:hypothetical protein [Alphaproteobacteria bacterium]
MLTAAAALLLASAPAHAYVDEACQELAAQGAPEGYNEQAQQDYLQNYFALATTLSPIHSVVPHSAGRGSLGVDVLGIPPLGCKRRLVLSYGKTEDTNKTPIAPRLRGIFTFPKLGPVAIYAGAGYVPPVTFAGTRNVITSGELGFGLPAEGTGFEWGGRFHYTMQKTIGEIATPFVEGDPAVDDLYLGSTFGFDVMLGFSTPKVNPYLAVGITDASTFFYIGDDGLVGNNLSPYIGLSSSLGVQGKLGEHFQWAGEFYAAPYNFSPTTEEESGGGDPNFARAQFYTGRLRASFVFGKSES